MSCVRGVAFWSSIFVVLSVSCSQISTTSACVNSNKHASLFRRGVNQCSRKFYNIDYEGGTTTFTRLTHIKIAITVKHSVECFNLYSACHLLWHDERHFDECVYDYAIRIIVIMMNVNVLMLM